MPKILILTGSTRPGRFNIQPATWVHELAKKRKDIEVELVDLQELNLPFLDEAVPPRMSQYSQPHTKAWSEKIAGADGFVLVTPEYNHSFSPVLKNALDYLYYEWHYKPVTFVSYGSQAGGTRAVEHLRSVSAELKMYDLAEQVMLSNYWENMSTEGKYQFTQDQTAAAGAMLDTLTFWAEAMKAARGTLKS
jgi:NAD(P)H-dependent FMN reductase